MILLKTIETQEIENSEEQMSKLDKICCTSSYLQL